MHARSWSSVRRRAVSGTCSAYGRSTPKRRLAAAATSGQWWCSVESMSIAMRTVPRAGSIGPVSLVTWLLVLAAATVLLYALFLGGLVLAGRSGDARAVAGLIPDCIVLLQRLLGDARMPRRYRAVVVALLGYLALPFDLVPDFIPVAGQLDDAIVVALTLRAILRRGGPEMIEEHWPGPRSSLSLILRLADRGAKP